MVGLFRSHICRSSNNLAKPCVECLVCQSMIDRFGNAKVDYFRNGLSVMFRHQDVRRFDVTVNDGLLMCVCDRMTGVNENGQTIGNRQFFLVAIGG